MSGRLSAALAGLVLAGTAVAPAVADEGNWHLFTQSHGGTVSLLHGLSKETCEYARARALGLPATEAERELQAQIDRKRHGEQCPPEGANKDDWKKWQAEHPAAIGCMRDGGGVGWGFTEKRSVSAGDIDKAECFQ